MLERYFSKPDTIDEIRACWLGDAIELYVSWLSDREYASACVRSRVPVLKRFAAFAWDRGARTCEELPDLVEPFVTRWIDERAASSRADRRRKHGNEVRGPIEQLVALQVPSFAGRGRLPHARGPFLDQAPGFFTYLREERGLSEGSERRYGHSLRIVERYLARIGVRRLAELSPAILSALVTEVGRELSGTSMNGLCCSLRVFLRYAFREGLIARDLSGVIEAPRRHRLSTVPRSISWDEVRRMLESVDRRVAVGKRDYAILLLLVTYGLRAQEIAALTLDDIDWERERLLVPERKAGHCTAYPLSSVVGEALLDHLEKARPATSHRQVFLRVLAPRTPMTQHAISNRATHYLRKAGIRVRRPGSHTLRHSCVQRLVDAQFPFKTIGDYVGHRSPQSTEVYTKVDIASLRDVAIGDGEALL